MTTTATYHDPTSDDTTSDDSALAAIAQVLAQVGADAAIHIRSLDGPGQIAINADQQVVTASTYKVAVLLELAAQGADGEIDLARLITVPASRRSPGVTGLSGMTDDVHISPRDLALLMMQVSDNTATDILQQLVGTGRITHRLRSLGLTQTRIETDCDGLIRLLLDEFGVSLDDLQRDLDTIGPDGIGRLIAASPSLNAERGNVSTPREMTTLLESIWQDRAATPEACRMVREIMAKQFAPHRLATGFADNVTIAAKTGTLFGGVRNEVGVIEYSPTDRYAVAIFLRQHGWELRYPAADRAIGTIARMGINALQAARRRQ